MTDIELLKRQIRGEFTDTTYPGDGRLRRSDEGEEPFLLEQEFRGKTVWWELDPAFLDQAPAGFATALAFFSDEAFQFYLPAYLIADIDGCLTSTNVVFYLTHGLDDESREKLVNPRRYEGLTWFEAARSRFSRFTPAQAAVIVAYLQYKQESGDLFDLEISSIQQALAIYWLDRLP